MRLPLFRILLLPRSSNAGASTFAEDPKRTFDEARILWSAAIDPTVLTVSACAAGDGTFDLTRNRYLVAIDRQGHEHVAVGARGNTLRLDVVSGTLLNGPVALQVHLDCAGPVPTRLSALDSLLRLIGIRDAGRRSPQPDARLARLIEALRVSDALVDGASLSTIAASLLGAQWSEDWPGEGDSIKSLVRRKVDLARRLTAGGPIGVMRHQV
ncbi:MAG: DNA -binding domain-containing protein [Sphingomonas sp.]